MKYLDYILIAAIWILTLSVLPDVIAMEQTAVDVYAGYAERYGWPLMAIVGSPILSWRITQWVKLAIKRNRGKKPSTLKLDILSFAIVYLLTYLAWSEYAGNAAYIAAIIGILHTAIVKAVFAYAPKKVVDAISYGVTDDTVMTIFVGRDRRKSARTDEDITERP